MELERIKEAAPREHFMGFATINGTVEPFFVSLENPALRVQF